MVYRVAVVGTGPGPGHEGEGFGGGTGMGYTHGHTYRRNDNCELVACADIDPDFADQFGEEFDLPEGGVFEDHRAMLDAVEPDVVSVCTPPATHTDIVLDCARAGVTAVHCEKPLAETWGKARLLVQEADRRDVQLTVNHQLRYSEPVVRANELLAEGAIGDLTRVEASRSDLLHAGIHQLDLCSSFAGDVPAEWLLGAIDYEGRRYYGMACEKQGLVLWQYENGVYGLASTGAGSDAVDPHNRLVGTAGEMAVSMGEPYLRVRRDGAGWETVDCEYRGDRAMDRTVDRVLGSIGGEPPAVRGENALIATELVYGCWESVRRRGRVDFPLAIADNPLEELAASGAFD